jgi:hypothetical protein
MRFSQFFDLGLIQAQLDFVDIELTEDQPLFIDPYALQIRTDQWSIDCTQAIQIYFQSLVDLIRRNDRHAAMQLLSALHEPRETRFGLSESGFSGSGIGSDMARDLYGALAQSRAVQTGFLKDLADAELFIPKISHDRISDLTTNLIRKPLIEYTQQQCRLHGVPLVGTVPSGPLWGVDEQSWTEEYVQLPVANGEKVLLVPKMAVRWETLLTSSDYYSRFVLEYLRAQELSNPASRLVRVLRDGRRIVTKRRLKEAFPFSKEWLLQFSEANPSVLEDYKRTQAGVANLVSPDIEEGFDEKFFAGILIRHLSAIPVGREAANQYHKFMVGTLEFLFYPALTLPKVEREINDGRKRIDISFLNADRTGFFHRFPNITRRSSVEVIVECKNYSRDLANPEIDQIAGRFADHRGWLGLLVCRRNESPDTLLARCRDNAIERHGFILPLDDDSITRMLRLIEAGRRDQVTGILDTLLRELTR